MQFVITSLITIPPISMLEIVGRSWLDSSLPQDRDLPKTSVLMSIYHVEMMPYFKLSTSEIALVEFLSDLLEQ